MSLWSIFLVDDEADVRVAVKFYLENEGPFKVTTFRNGTDIWNAIREGFNYNALVTDMGYDGVPYMRVVEHSLHENPVSPVILWSGHDDYTKSNPFKEDSRVHRVLKGRSTSVLADKLREVLHITE